jgi:hypothetical protein
MISRDDLCKQLWSSFNALKEATEEASEFLSEREDFTLAEINKRIKALSAAKDEYEKYHYTKLPDGREIYTLDYLAILRFCEKNNFSFKKVLGMQPDDFLEDRRVVKFLWTFAQGDDVSPLADLTSLRWLGGWGIEDLDLSPLDLTSLELFDCSRIGFGGLVRKK